LIWEYNAPGLVHARDPRDIFSPQRALEFKAIHHFSKHLVLPTMELP